MTMRTMGAEFARQFRGLGLGLANVNRPLAARILLGRHRFQVLRIAASPNTTEVVNLQPVRDGADIFLVGSAVNPYPVTGAATDAVASVVDRLLPYPAGRGVPAIFNLRAFGDVLSERTSQRSSGATAALAHLGGCESYAHNAAPSCAPGSESAREIMLLAALESPLPTPEAYALGQAPEPLAGAMSECGSSGATSGQWT
jgi:hypothetical protein